MCSSRSKIDVLSFVLLLMAATNPSGFAANHQTAKLRLKIVEVGAGTLLVNMLNVSDQPLRIWNSSNSWGAGRWRIVLIRNNQIMTFFQNPDEFFTKNNPGYHEISENGMV